ncbi:MAG: hypothetical protein ACRDHP_16415, partial [Ktedonobacterales bacterium]
GGDRERRADEAGFVAAGQAPPAAQLALKQRADHPGAVSTASRPGRVSAVKSKSPFMAATLPSRPPDVAPATSASSNRAGSAAAPRRFAR